MEATGYTFYDTDGTPKEGLQLLKDRGMNTIRLRVFVNPSSHKTNGHCSAAETVAMAVRAKNMGMRIMIDFHYSDTFADPGHQAKPAAWAGHTFSQLKDDVYAHTFDVLNALKTAGVTPEWVQIGNEIPSGMLWPEGKIVNNQNWNQLAALLNKGYEATKAVNSSTKVVVHINQGHDNAGLRWFFDNITSNYVKYDVIGMSYYPYWLGSDYTATILNLENNLKDMVSRYGKEVMVVEVGGDYTLIQNTYDMLLAVINAVKAVPNNKGLGVIYWEPQGANSWSGYQLNAWQANGKPSPALGAFKNPPFNTDSLYPSPNEVIPYHSEWTKTHYIERIAEFKNNPLQLGDIVFIGNSITEQGGNWGQRFNNSKVKNRGITGDVVGGVLNRLAEIYYYKPRKVFLKIGINDLFQANLTPEYVANAISEIVAKIHLESPETKIYVQTILPTSNNTSLKNKIAATNAIIKNSVQTNYYQVIDLHSIFADTNDLMISTYSVDGIHLTESGYNLWKNYVAEFVGN
jgi:arabinogalactan endo-1,4-beta-galactosidase